MYTQIKQELAPSGVRLIAVSKTKTNDQIMVLYNQGQRDFGENRVQEVVEKHDTLPKDIHWHLIGHLQTNKVKYIAPFISMVHSVDSLKLLAEIDKQAARNDRTIDCLLQFKIALEDTKYGLDLDTAHQLLTDPSFAALRHVRICGVMGMATFTEDTAQVKSEFEQLTRIFNTLKETYFASSSYFTERSMGMSDDYPLAVEAGSTMVRIGTLLFGSRS
ncbi:MAG: YggS family pyridoxal phosphate-dependent enzyme [Lewinellaceae bacterium]|nr:YggS family pyridoxal phosphate-dependent enzyme [Lewinellaceae bacterium]